MNSFTASRNDETAIAAAARKSSVVLDSIYDAENTKATPQAISAKFDPGHGVLTVDGDKSGNVVTIGRDAAGTILINGGAVQVPDHTPTVAETSVIKVAGNDGDDVITIDASNGPMPNAILSGGNGNDTLVGGAGDDQLDGGADDDTLIGGDGNDTLLGGDGNDLITGGRGSDVARMGNGDDTFVWNPGDGSDVVEGQAGNDTLLFNGAIVGEKIDISANGGRVGFSRDVGTVTMDLNGVETIDFNARGGTDTITVNDLHGTDARAVNIDLGGVPGGAGDGQADTVILVGSVKADTIVAQSVGAETVISGLGADVHVSGTDAGLDQLQIQGGAQNDTIDASGLAANGMMLTIDGGVGNDTITGGAGNDTLLGGDGNDLIVGGRGNDVAQLGAGDDTFVWNPGDGSDVVEGGEGTDTMLFNGAVVNESIGISANGGRVALSRDVGAVTMDVNGVENIVVHAGGGDDTIIAGNGLAPLVQLTLDGGEGNDTITGGDGSDILIGGDGNDVIAGGRGNDVAQLGTGDDTFVWNPGDGSDTVEGGVGTDVMQFNGASIGEKIDISANAGRVRLTRDVGTVTMDLNGIETIDLSVLGGTDTITVDDLSGTDVKRMNIDLAVPGGASDGQADTIKLAGSGKADTITVQTSGAETVVAGLAAEVHVTGVDGGLDQLQISTGARNDTINASGLAADGLVLTIDGGAGDDTITGSGGNDTLLGGDGNDLIVGGRGNDVAQLGDGDDTFVWNPGDGSDTVEGQAGNDTMLFNGANIGEKIDISANGGRVRFSRDVAAITMDLNGVETAVFNALGGADTITVDDLTGTDMRRVNIDLGGVPGGAGDGAIDTVRVMGSAQADSIVARTAGGETVVSGLAAEVHVTGSDSGLDQLEILAGAQNDTIDASHLSANGMSLTVNAGAGDDTIIGSGGNDTIIGGQGSDVARMGAGDDTFVWNPGDGSDVVEGQAGNDTMRFNGANIGEKIDISANGGRVGFSRDIGTVNMDLNSVETIDFNALGGADTITVHDLTGTGVSRVNVDLAGTPGGSGGDGSSDNVVIEGTNGDDVIRLSMVNGALVVDGLATQIVIEHFDVGDQIHLMGLGGNDVIDASSLAAGSFSLFLDGGSGDDVLIGSGGDDVLLGGAGDDVLIGGPGQDVLDGGPGNNVLIQ